jgi:hypothetical protein
MVLAEMGSVEKSQVVAELVGNPENHTDVIVEAGSTDPPDTSCWGCGSLDIDWLNDGPLLCSPCLEDLDSEPQENPLHLVRGSYWQTHTLVCCWRCIVAPVDPADEVGLCPTCQAQLSEA